MNLKNLQLPDFVIAELYKKDLVQLNDAAISKKEEQAEQRPWYLGNNVKEVCIAIKDPSAFFINDDWLQFLTNILAACKLNMQDVAIINCNQHSKTHKELQAALQPKYYLLFDIDAKDIQLPFTIPHYQIQSYGNATYLLAPSLNTMMGDSKEAKLEKSKLWLSLKKIFEV